MVTKNSTAGWEDPIRCSFRGFSKPLEATWAHRRWRQEKHLQTRGGLMEPWKTNVITHFYQMQWSRDGVEISRLQKSLHAHLWSPYSSSPTSHISSEQSGMMTEAANSRFEGNEAMRSVIIDKRGLILTLN